MGAGGLRAQGGERGFDLGNPGEAVGVQAVGGSQGAQDIERGLEMGAGVGGIEVGQTPVRVGGEEA